jgi:RNA polymerase sigma-70 factor (ECF subfamily)
MPSVDASPIRTTMSEPAGGPDLDFESFTHSHYAHVLAYLRWRTRDPHLAQDLAQETFLQAYRNRQSFDPARGHERGWLLGIARHVSANAARRQGARPQQYPGMDAIADGAWIDPRGPRQESERLTALQRCIETLTSRAREILHLIYTEHMAYAEIAKRIGMGLSAVKVAACRARQALAECMRRRLTAAGPSGPADP